MRRQEQFPHNGFEAWGGYMQAKVAKLEDQFDQRMDEKESTLFEGISIFVNGYTTPSADELKIIMSKHGGVYHAYQRSNDYVIASNLPDFKVKKLTTAKIVKPEWITESLAAKCLLDYKQYLLYSKHTRTQARLQFNTAVTQKFDESPVDCYSVERNDQDCNRKNEHLTEEYSENKIDTINISNVKVDETSIEIESSDFLAANDAELPSDDNTVETEKIVKPLPNASSSGKNDTKTAIDPNFLSEFYSKSRLHHISQLGAKFKQYVNDLRDASDYVFPARIQLKRAIESIETSKEPELSVNKFKGDKLIMHIDMDCFFVSVGLRRRPELLGRPVAVTHARGQAGGGRSHGDRQTEYSLYKQRNVKALSKATGISEDKLLRENSVRSRVDDLHEDEGFGSMSEIASCSYEARAKGVRNGMFMGTALRLCPDLKTIPYDFDAYEEVAYTLYNTIAQYTLDMEAVSCDELYCECTELVTSLGVCPARFATTIRREIREKTGCPCSTGFGANRLQARLATKKAKPDGQFFLTSQLVDKFMMDMNVADLPGVGKQLLQRIESACGCGPDATCAALRPLSLAALQRHLGAAAGRMLFHYCRGEDNRSLKFVTVRKSVSAEVNYGIRWESEEQVERFLRQLCGEVHARLLRARMLAKSVTLKVMLRAEDAPVETAKYMGHGFCDTVNKTSTLAAATNSRDVITAEVLQLCAKFRLRAEDIRGVGIQLTKLESSHKHNNNPLTAFFLRPGKEVHVVKETVKESYSNSLVDHKNDPVNVQEQRSNFLSSWITKTPPKQEGTGPVTPIKSIQSAAHLKKSPASTPQKSPLKKKTLGLTGRRRGRPPRSASTPAGPASATVMRRFLAGAHLPPEIESVDPEFLAALPDDIRQEIVEHYHPLLLLREPSGPRTPTAPHTTASLKTTSAQADNTRQEYRVGGACTPQPLLELPWQQTLELLRSWFAEPRPPPPCDVELVSTYLQNMVIARNIDNLVVLVNFLKRNTQEKRDDSWSAMCSHIVEGLQQTMTVVYGKPLLLK